MALHRLLGIDLGVPNPQTLDDFYQHIGFVGGDHSWGPKEAPDQIRVKEAPYRQLLEMRVACHSEKDLSEIAGRLDGIGIKHETSDGKLVARDPVNMFTVTIQPKEVADVPEPEPRPVNRPGNRPRKGARPGIMTEPTLRPPRRLGHVVIGTPNIVATHDFFVNALGFRVSDKVAGGLAYFTRCSQDHHNLLFAPAPVPYLNHYAIERDDIDAVMASATLYLKENHGTQIAGPGRHPIGGNMFWYLRDPAGNYFEQFADMDCIKDDDAWEVVDWNPPGWSLWGDVDQPEVFFKPTDMADLIHGYNKAHG